MNAVLPKEMAIELYKPFVIRRLIERGYVKQLKVQKGCRQA
jgi:DNA-directed RNA polymerase subunit beta'